MTRVRSPCICGVVFDKTCPRHPNGRYADLANPMQEWARKVAERENRRVERDCAQAILLTPWEYRVRLEIVSQDGVFGRFVACAYR